MQIKIGAKYRHYKGKDYEVIGTAKHSETLEDLVVYRALYSGEFPDGQIWVRPLSMWFDHIERPGENGTRFTLIED